MRILVKTYRRFTRLLSWPGAEQKAVLYSVFALPAAELFLRVIGYRRTKALFLRKDVKEGAERTIDAFRAYEIVRWVAMRTIGKDEKCLRRSLVLAHILQANGYPVTVHFGFRKDADGALKGHAWCDYADSSAGPPSSEGRNYVRFE